MRIGIVPSVNPTSGGIYQYSLTMLHAIDAWRNDGCEDEFVVFAPGVPHPALVSLTEHGWTLKPLTRPPSCQQQALHVLRRIVGEGPHREAWRWLRRARQWNETPLPDPDIVKSRPDMKRWLRRCGTDLMLYPVPSALSFETGIPYVMAIHDLQHRLQPEFPEVSANGEWERREYNFRNGARYATLLLADSEVGKEDILNFYGPYGVTPDRVKVLPFIPAYYLAPDVSESERQRVRATYSLPERYLFYPAQFWPHKNHIRIVQALGLLKQAHQLTIPVVFCGSYDGEIREPTFREVMTFRSQLGLEGELLYLGHAPDEDMSGLYAGAAALVMPTFFGPTNIPVLEAWAFGCPVLTSDIRGVREQVGDAALLVDPASVEAIADGIHRLWTNRELGRTLADLGRRRLAAYTPEGYLCRLMEIVEEGKERVRSEKPPHAKNVTSI
jgi:glycosyltransferase involved in cell wall biosynthesis